MKDINPDNLESAISSAKKSTSKADKESITPQLSPEEEKGFHKGALNTLAAERNELIKIIANVEAIMQAHLKRLEELGVNLGKK